MTFNQPLKSLCLLCALLPLNLSSAAPSPEKAKAPAGTPPSAAASFKITTDRPDGIYRQGDPVTFAVQMLEDGRPVAGRKLFYTIKGDGGLEQKGQATSALEPVKITARLDVPGWICLKVNGTDADGKSIPWWKLTGIAGAAVDPFQVKAGQTVPADFDEFWAQQKAALAKAPKNLTETPGTLERDADRFKAYHVKVDIGPGLRPLTALVTIPSDAAPKSLAAQLSFPGAGIRSAGFQTEDGKITLSMNVHGIEDLQPAEYYSKLRQEGLSGYTRLGAKSRETYYYRGVFLRILRALEYVKARPEWDGTNLAVAGGSQGGGLALVAAGLDPDVSLCNAGMPAMCDHLGYARNQYSGWPQLVAPDAKTNQPPDPEVAKTSGYYDAANFATRIKADTEVSIGLLDTTCPPTSVFAAFNNLAARKKTLWIFPEAGHMLQGRKFELKPSAP